MSITVSAQVADIVATFVLGLVNHGLAFPCDSEKCTQSGAAGSVSEKSSTQATLIWMPQEMDPQGEGQFEQSRDPPHSC